MLKNISLEKSSICVVRILGLHQCNLGGSNWPKSHFHVNFIFYFANKQPAKVDWHRILTNSVENLCLVEIGIERTAEQVDKNSGREARISKEETRTTLTMDLQEIPPQLIKVSCPDKTLHTKTTSRIMEHHTAKARINHSVKTMEIGLEMDISTIRMETGETWELSLVLHRLKGKNFHKIIYTANQEAINLTILLSADLTTDLRLVSCLTSKHLHKRVSRRHPTWFASPQLTMPFLNYETFAR